MFFWWRVGLAIPVPAWDAASDSTVFDPEAQTRRELVEVKLAG